MSKEDKVAQVGPVSLGGRGNKFCGNLPRNLRAELPQVAPKVQNGRPKGGEREAARQLGLDRDDVRRAIGGLHLPGKIVSQKNE